MRIKNGCTRMVILTKTSAIKIAFPLRPFRPFGIILENLLSGELRGKLGKHHGNLLQLLVRIVTFGGIDANRRELRLSREHPEYPIMPVMRSYLGGFVIVMARGEPHEQPGDQWGSRVALPSHLRDADLFYTCNSGWYDGRLRFFDYGDPTAEEILPLLCG